MILINEENMGAYSMGDAERVVTEFLLAKGADVIDSELVKTNVNRDKARDVKLELVKEQS